MAISDRVLRGIYQTIVRSPGRLVAEYARMLNVRRGVIHLGLESDPDLRSLSQRGYVAINTVGRRPYWSRTIADDLRTYRAASPVHQVTGTASSVASRMPPRAAPPPRRRSTRAVVSDPIVRRRLASLDTSYESLTRSVQRLERALGLRE